MSFPDPSSLEVRLGARLHELGLQLALVESCTGGLASYRITSVPGSSAYFLGGCVAYSYEAKERALGVRHETLYNYGAVSRETALEMANGARRTLGAEVDIQKVIAAAITGIAGPGGGMPTKPVGLVWVAICSPTNEFTWQFNFDGDREAIRQAAAEAALQKILETINGQST
jgi:PncC family amidohydrolase